MTNYAKTIIVLAVIELLTNATTAIAITGIPSWKPRETVSIEALDTSSEGADRMLAYDHHGNPGIAFIDAVDGVGLLYARRVPGFGWTSTEIDPNASVSPSLAYDRYERPAISYDGTNGLQFAHFDGSSWQFETVDPINTSYTALAFDILGHAAIAYTDSANFSLKYVRDTDGDFTFTDETPVTVSSGFATGFFPSLAFDSLNRPMIGHGDFQNSEILFSLNEPGLGWITTTVAAEPPGISIPSLAIDPDNDYPAIAFADQTKGLRYAAWNGTVWDITSVDPNADSTSRLSIAFDPGDGNPVISYGVFGPDEMRFAWNNGSTWQSQTIDSGTSFLQNSVAFNDFGNGFASVAYLTSSNRLYFVEDPPLTVPEPTAWALLLIGLASLYVRDCRTPTA